MPKKQDLLSVSLSLLLSLCGVCGCVCVVEI